MSSIERPEILIVGAGPGGSAAAWALARTGHDVLLVDAADFPRDKTCGDGLAPLAVRLLREMGLLAEVEAAGAARLSKVYFSAPFGPTVCLPFDECMEPGTYALALPRLTFDDLIRQHAGRAGARFRGGLRVRRLAREGDRIVRVEAGSADGPVEIQPAHVIVAVGASMGLLAREGFIPENLRPIRAVRAYYENLTQLTDCYAFFYDLHVQPGYGWVFPTGNGSANIGVGLFRERRKKSLPAALEQFVARTIRRGGLSGQTRRAGPIKGYPIRTDFPSHQVAGGNWTIIGEAAGLVNPLTAEGIDLALDSGLLAAEIMDAGMQARRGDHHAYQRALIERYAGLFRGLRIVRDVMMNPLLIDFFTLRMQRRKLVGKVIVEMAQGFRPATSLLQPRFLIELLTPFTGA